MERRGKSIVLGDKHKANQNFSVIAVIFFSKEVSKSMIRNVINSVMGIILNSKSVHPAFLEISNLEAQLWWRKPS